MERTNPELADALARLEAAWASAGDLETSGLMAPGLTAREIDEAVADLDLELHPDVVTWFGWHNGPMTPGRMVVFGPAWMVGTDIRLAIHMYELHLRYAREGAEGSNWSLADAGWDPHWFPAFKDMAGTVCAVDCSAAGDIPAPIRTIIKGDDDPATIDGPGLLWVVEQWIWAIEAGVCRFTDGEWVTDEQRVPPNLSKVHLL